MRALPVSFGPAARRDMTEIHSYILNISSNPDVADRYVRRLYEFCLRIGDVPEGGPAISSAGGRHRRRVFERSLVVIYEARRDGVEIKRVFSGRKLIASFLR